MDFSEYRKLFENGCLQLCEDLGFDYNKIEYDNEEITNVYYFQANGENDERSFVLDFKLVWEDGSEESDATLTINYSKGANPFFFSEKIGYLVSHGDFMGRWAAWAVQNYRKIHDNPDLNSLFSGADIKTYGLPNLSRPTKTELEVFLTGAKTLNEELMIYRFRHAEGEVHYRAFSFAFNFPSKDNVWIFFPQLGALDSGAAYRDFQQAEELIKLFDSSKVTRKNFDIDYEELSQFLSRKSFCFKDSDKNYNEIDQYIDGFSFGAPIVFGSNFESSYKEFSNQLKKKRYADALRDLRALLQESLEKLSDKHSIAYPPEPKIHSLVASLIDNGEIIDRKLRNWFDAYTDIANRASHSTDIPSNEAEYSRLQLERIFLTIRLGIFLVSEIENKM